MRANVGLTQSPRLVAARVRLYCRDTRRYEMTQVANEVEEGITHLDSFVVPLKAIQLGEPENQWGWGAYKTTWNLLRQGITNFEELSLFESYRRYYSKQNRKFLAQERGKYNLGHGNSKEIAVKRMRCEIQLFEHLETGGCDAEVDGRIGANGEIVVDSKHIILLSALKHLKRKRITVNMKSRHEEWGRLKDILFEMNGGKTLHQPIEHPDFSDWPVTGGCHEQLDAILASCGKIKNTHVLDASADTGWFSRKFTSIGTYVLSAEPDMTKYYVATRLSQVFGFGTAYPAYFLKSFDDVLNQHVDHPSTLGQTRFEAILFLNKIHEYAEEDDDKLWDDLRLISEYGNSMYADVPPSWKPKSILKHTEFKYYEKVLDSDNPLYVYRRAKP